MATMQERLAALIASVGADIKSLTTQVSNLGNVPPYAGGAWKAVVANTFTVNSTTEYDMPNLSVTVPVLNSSDKFMVSLTTDMQVLNATAVTFIGRLWVDGVVDTAQHIVAPGAAGTAFRMPQTSLWLVESLLPGDRVFKMMGRVSGSVNSIAMSHTHSRITVWRIL